MATPQYAYDFDPYGDNPNNRVTGERHTITPANGQDFNYFVPDFAPFHRRNFVMRSVTNNIVGGELKATTDYYFGFRYDQMILSGGMEPIYGAIVLNDPQFAGSVSIDYNTLGGEYTLSTTQIATLLANNQLDPRVTQWTSVTGAPTEVPAVPHKHNAMETLVGMDSLVDAVYVVIDSISTGFNKAYQALQEHLKDHNNPHQVTARQVGVDGNGSLVPADQAEAEAGVDNNKYMTSLRVLQSIQQNALPVIAAHVADKNNPHAVTQAQVGLGAVQNYPMATATEAEAGVASNRYMTPSTVLAAMTYRVPLLMQFHTTDFNNPHKTTKAHVGLGNVPNYAKASVAQAVSGTDDTTLMTPYLVAQAVATGSSQGLAAHLLDYTNPHKVTQDQVGLGNVQNYGLATVAQAQAGTDKTTYMTPYLVSVMLASNVGGSIDAHIADHNNPHQVSAAQVGLGSVPNFPKSTAPQAIAGTDDASLMTPYMVAQAIAVGVPQSLSAHLADTQNPHQVSASQVGLGAVQNYPMATDSDMSALTNAQAYVSPSNLKFLLDGALADSLQGSFAAMGNTTPIFANGPDLFAAVGSRYPYEYTFLRPITDGSPWDGDSAGYYPRFTPSSFAASYQVITDDQVTEAGFGGAVTRGTATMVGFIVGLVELYDDTNGSRIGYIMLRVAGTKVDLVLRDTKLNTFTALPSFTAITLSSALGTNSPWAIDPIWTDGNYSSVVASIGDSASFTIDLVALVTAEAALDGTVIDPAIGFAVTSAAQTTRFSVATWLDNELYYRDLSQANACYQLVAGTWTAVDVSVVKEATTSGAWYYNRFSGESFGAATKSDLVPLRGKRLVTSDEIVVTESATDIKLSLSGSVKRELAMGANDITFDM